jgi:23S rRNA (guanosine2251-2'-O)-methyltransferase
MPSYTDGDEGVLHASEPRHELVSMVYSISLMRQNLVAVLHNIRSRENVGSMFRTADAAGVAKLYLCGITPQPPHEKIAKTALGAEAYVPWEYTKQAWRLLESLKKQGYTIIALEKTPQAQNLFDIHIKAEKIAIVAGNEVEGLSPEILKRCDTIAAIPMRGKKESLNVAVAFGISVYALTQHK